MADFEENSEIKAIADAIEDQFYTHQTSRLDIILLPFSETVGIFYVIYTVEFVDVTNIGSVGIEKGIYYYDKEKKTLKIQVGRFEKVINLS